MEPISSPALLPYSLYNKLGDGGQADVYLASQQLQLYAVKIYHSGPIKAKAYHQEAHYLSRLSHPHLIHMSQHYPEATITTNKLQIERRPMMVM